MLGNPKITFVLGKDVNFRETICQKLVEEFQYTYISSAKLQEIESQKSKKKSSDGNMEISALIANPSKNYLMDGFPSTADQAVFFEQNVCECQTVLYFDEQTDEENKEIQDPYDLGIKEVVNKYKLFGKVRFINANQEIEDVYNDVKHAIMPEVFFLIGPKGSGKTTIGKTLAHRTNMLLMNFDEFIKKNSLTNSDDETIVFKLIKTLLNEVSPRILLEGFPQNQAQARCFIKNWTTPEKVYYLRWSKDTCQERMITLGKDHPSYVSSVILSKRIKMFHEQTPTLIPFLQENTAFYEIDCEHDLISVNKQINDSIEPTIIHIRSGTNAELKNTMISHLVLEHGFINLEVNTLIRFETERRTEVGQEFFSIVSAGKIIPADMIVKMLRKIIYSGQQQNKFILNGFPDINEQVEEFEKNWAKISAIFLTTNEGEGIVEIKNNNLTLFNIDSLFQKEFRLKVIDSWDFTRFNEMLGAKTDIIIVTGTWASGKTTVWKYLQSSFGYQIIDINQAIEEVKKKHEGDEEQPEGIPTNEVIEQLLSNLEKMMQTCSKIVFDTFPGTTPEHFDAILDFLGIPDYVFYIDCDLAIRKLRYLKSIEAEEWTEEHEEQTKNLGGNTIMFLDHVREKYSTISPDRFRILEFNLSGDSMKKQINDELSPKVILVCHDKRLGCDSTCANLAIKYNFIYISVYQLIRKHITGNTVFGKQLLATKKPREINLNSSAKDEFQEIDYSAVHFDLPLVLRVIKSTINEVIRGQKFILLEGLCNTGKLTREEDILELRPMDELIEIEREIGDIVAIASLKFSQDIDTTEENEVEYEEFPEPPPVEEKKAEGEGEGDEIPKQPEDEGEGEKKEDFKVEEYQWTITNKKPKNLAQVYIQLKGANAVHEIKNAEEYSTSQYESISKSLDEFVTRVVDQDLRGKNPIVQIVFNE